MGFKKIFSWNKFAIFILLIIGGLIIFTTIIGVALPLLVYNKILFLEEFIEGFIMILLGLILPFFLYGMYNGSSLWGPGSSIFSSTFFYILIIFQFFYFLGVTRLITLIINKIFKKKIEEFSGKTSTILNIIYGIILLVLSIFFGMYLI